MKPRFWIVALGLAAVLFTQTESNAQRRRARKVNARFAATQPWHANYYHHRYGQPVALVVPPVANTYRSMAWGVSQNEVLPIHHQFQRSYPGMYGGGAGPFHPTPYWPSHTDQFGVYYIRGPW